MREILFRGKTGCLWAYGHVRKLGNKTFMYEVDGYPSVVVDPDTVGQYTGLTDKNGKKIFEGDICRNTKTNEIVSVKWHGTMAGYVWRKRRADNRNLYDFGELFRAFDKYEVIGNIYDNPELMEDK